MTRNSRTSKITLIHKLKQIQTNKYKTLKVIEIINSLEQIVR